MNIPSIKKSKVKYIHEWILKSQEEHVWEGIKSLNAFVVNNIISQCISHNNLLCLENISHKKEMLFTKNENILEGINYEGFTSWFSDKQH